MRFYDFPDAYDLFFTEDFDQDCQRFYQAIFAKKKLKEMIDCTVGTGKMAIPLAKLGYTVSGCDINSRMIRKAKQNFANDNIVANLFQCDILELSEKVKRDFDCVMSTGNSLAHLKNDQLKTAIAQMDSILRPGGVLYIDSRNWDIMLKRKQRFYLYNPIIRDKGRVNYIQVWDYNKNGSITFNYLMFEEIENKIVSKRQFYEIYYPFHHDILKGILEELNYINIHIFKLGDMKVDEMDQIDWYTITAEKPFR